MTTERTAADVDRELRDHAAAVVAEVWPHGNAPANATEQTAQLIARELARKQIRPLALSGMATWGVVLLVMGYATYASFAAFSKGVQHSPGIAVLVYAWFILCAMVTVKAAFTLCERWLWLRSLYPEAVTTRFRLIRRLGYAVVVAVAVIHGYIAHVA